MKLDCKLLEKTFNDKDGNCHCYNVLSFDLSDNSTLDLPIKSDKAKLLKLSNQLNNSNNSKPDFWND